MAMQLLKKFTNLFFSNASVYNKTETSNNYEQKIVAAYNALANDYNNLIDHKPHNAYYDRPNTLSLLPTNLQGLHILDAGCGPGKYAEILLAKGAVVQGVDISPNMIELAQKRNAKHSKHFQVHNIVEPFTMFENNVFDIVICPLVLEYIENWDATFKEFYRLLKPNGILVVSIVHPFFDYNYFRSKAYFATEKVQCTWTGFGTPTTIYSYRRSLHNCMAPFLENGFAITGFIEPKPIEAFKQYDEKHYKELNAFPSFLCIRGTKL
jgi:2-polyprenyl-3-methyl-5-hydroxy-6-metoxy-1,4-benzoquinol methylase